VPQGSDLLTTNTSSGALFTKLAPTAVVLACYFCFADLILISQSLYYNTLNARRASRRLRQHQNPSDGDTASEDEPLLNARRRSSSMGLPGSQRRLEYHTESSLEPLRKIVTGEDQTPDSKPWLHNTLSILAVYLVGATGWFISYKFGMWDTEAPSIGDGSEAQAEVQTIGIVLGYFSALCYLLARIPQIIKNWQEKSCEGMSCFFVF
jgi:solute carrier family 66 (lysosomal lysine-arginine transporter), member 1